MFIIALFTIGKLWNCLGIHKPMNRIKKMWYIHNGVLFSYKEKQNFVICRKMDETGSHCVKQNKPDVNRKMIPVVSIPEVGGKGDKGE
jgi:hypothetical protein